METKDIGQPNNDKTRAARRLVATPGVFYGGGCSYMACRGLMFGGIEDVLLLTHGPVGCAYYAGINGFRGMDGRAGIPSFAGRTFVTALDETDVVFGGEQKLAAALDQAIERFHPKAVAVAATCPVGLIGDDIVQVCAEASLRHGIDVLPLLCEGFKSEPGWLHGARQMLDNWVGAEERPVGEFPIHFMSESFAGERGKRIRGMLERIGYDVVCSLMGSTTYDRIKASQQARLVVLDTGKAIDAIPQMYAQRYGSGFMRVSLRGVAATAESLRAIARYFDDKGLIERTEELIAHETERLLPAWRENSDRYRGWCVAIFEDIFRSNDYATLACELGMRCIMVAQDYSKKHHTDAGYEVHVPGSVAGALPLDLLAELGMDSDAWEIVQSLRGCEHVGSAAGERETWRRGVLDACQISRLLEGVRPDLCFAGIEERFGAGGRIRSEVFLSDIRGTDYVGFDSVLAFAADIERARLTSRWLMEEPKWMR